MSKMSAEKYQIFSFKFYLRIALFYETGEKIMHSEGVKARDEDSHPEKTAGKITVLYPRKPWRTIKVNFYDDKVKSHYNMNRK